jgi:HSP20 family molecular chaperone IbpA
MAISYVFDKDPKPIYIGYDEIDADLRAANEELYRPEFDPTKFPFYNILKFKDIGFTIQIYVPGFKKSDLDVSIDGDILTVNGKSVPVSDDVMFFKGMEVPNEFKRSFHLSDNVKVAKVGLDSGIMSIEILRLNVEPKHTDIPVDFNDPATPDFDTPVVEGNTSPLVVAPTPNNDVGVVTVDPSVSQSNVVSVDPTPVAVDSTPAVVVPEPQPVQPSDQISDTPVTVDPPAVEVAPNTDQPFPSVVDSSSPPVQVDPQPAPVVPEPVVVTPDPVPQVQPETNPVVDPLVQPLDNAVPTPEPVPQPQPEPISNNAPDPLVDSPIVTSDVVVNSDVNSAGVAPVTPPVSDPVAVEPVNPEPVQPLPTPDVVNVLPNDSVSPDNQPIPNPVEPVTPPPSSDLSNLSTVSDVTPQTDLSNSQDTTVQPQPQVLDQATTVSVDPVADVVSPSEPSVQNSSSDQAPLVSPVSDATVVTSDVPSAPVVDPVVTPTVDDSAPVVNDATANVMPDTPSVSDTIVVVDTVANTVTDANTADVSVQANVSVDANTVTTDANTAPVANTEPAANT